MAPTSTVRRGTPHDVGGMVTVIDSPVYTPGVGLVLYFAGDLNLLTLGDEGAAFLYFGSSTGPATAATTPTRRSSRSGCGKAPGRSLAAAPPSTPGTASTRRRR